MYANFLLGHLRVTPDARIKLKRLPLDLIARHAVNDHGNITRREAKLNEIALKRTGRIVSRYFLDPTDHSQGSVMVVTHESWDDTVVKLEDETEDETEDTL